MAVNICSHFTSLWFGHFHLLSVPQCVFKWSTFHGPKVAAFQCSLQMSNISSCGIMPVDSPRSPVSAKMVLLLNSIPNKNWKLPFSSDQTSSSKDPVEHFQRCSMSFFLSMVSSELKEGLKLEPSQWLLCYFIPNIYFSLYALCANLHSLTSWCAYASRTKRHTGSCHSITETIVWCGACVLFSQQF